MWALRRASANYVKAQVLNLATFRTCAGLGRFNSHTEDKSSNFDHCDLTSDKKYITYECVQHFPHQFSAGSHSLSSQAGAKSGGQEGDLEEGFSELEGPEPSKTMAATDEGSDSSSESESDSSNADENVEESLDTELIKDADMDLLQKSKKKMDPLLKLILKENLSSIPGSLDKYAADGSSLSHNTIYDVMMNLRRRRMFLKALQLSDWLEKRDDFEFTDRDYASRVDLIAKMRGLQRAESYIDTIPKSHRQEVIYTTLLANCVSLTNVAKAEEIFNKMKDLGFSRSTFAFNQLLVLYKRTDKKKIADVLLMMEKEDVKPTLFTYKVLVDTKGLVNDMVGMEQVVETMKAEGIEPDFRLLSTLARHYAHGGLKEKAEKVLKEIEGDDLKSNREASPVLLIVYANLGNADEVERIWKACESNPGPGEYRAVIEAWGKLKNTAEAEAIFKKMMKSVRKRTTRNYLTMLKVYAENKMLTEAKELLKQMGDSGCYIGPVAWDAIVMLYLEAGEVEKAESVLQKASQNQQKRPLFQSYISILDQYAKRGDVHNAERVFCRMRQCGYVSRARPFSALLRAYLNAKVPAYGFRERLKADNIFPNKELAGQLAQVDAFKKSAVSDLLD